MRKRISFSWPILIIIIIVCSTAMTIFPSYLLAAKELSKSHTPCVPFDVNQLKLSPNYKGCDTELLYKSLTKKYPPKNEFESHEQYARRIKKENTLYGFVVGGHDAVNCSYNAETREMDISLKPKSSIKAYFLFQTKEKVVKKGSYVGQNAFGAKKIIESITKNEYGIKILNGRDVLPGAGRDSNHQRIVTLKMDPTQAKQLKDKIMAVIIGSPDIENDFNSYPYRSAYSYYSEPTFDFPVELSTTSYYVNVNVKQIWFFTANGIILDNIDIEKEKAIAAEEDRKAAQKEVDNVDRAEKHMADTCVNLKIRIHENSRLFKNPSLKSDVLFSFDDSNHMVNAALTGRSYRYGLWWEADVTLPQGNIVRGWIASNEFDLPE